MRRTLPSSIHIVVTERVPIGIARLNNSLFLVDERGVVIDRFGVEYSDFDVPIIDGLENGSDESESRADPVRAELAGRVLAALRPQPEIWERVSQIDVSDLHDVTVVLSGDPAVVHLGEDRFLPRLQAYLELAPTLRARVSSIDYVDLRFDERIYVGPAGKPGKTGAVALASAPPGRRAAQRADRPSRDAAAR
jgi:cell division septal protein FtsQ